MGRAGRAGKLRKLVIPAAVFALILGGWLGGESVLAGKFRDALAGSAAMTVGSVAPLRDPARFGLALSDIRLNDGRSVIEVPATRLWISPLSPTTLRAELPPALAITPAPANSAESGVDGLMFALDGGFVAARVSPLHDLQLTRMELQSDGVTLNGRALAQSLSGQARLVSLAHDAPKSAGAAYDLDLALADLDPQSLPALQQAQLPEGTISVDVKGRVWLSEAVSPVAGDGDGGGPVLVGLRSDQTVIRIGDLKARLIGRLAEDEAGFLSGRVMIYTADARPLLEFLASLGVIPEKTIPLALTLLRGISRAGIEGADSKGDQGASPDALSRTVSAQDAPATAASAENVEAPDGYPLPAKDEIRLPLSFLDGKAMLGPIALGPAPRFPRE